MKLRTFLSLSIMFVSMICMAQLSTSAYIGIAPSKTLNSDAEYISDVMEGTDYGIKPNTQSITYLGGMSAQYTFTNGFFVGGDLEYQNSSIEFSLWNVSGASEDRPSMTVLEKEHRLVAPLYIGARLGNFNISTGVSVNAIVGKSSGFDEFDSFNDTSSKIYMGLHAGIGYDFGPIEIGLRYMQDFKNYAAGYQLAGQNMEFYGNRNRLVFVAKYNILKRG